ncbi:MAG TPA: DinB family protein [Gemmatimonadales bacterium]|nr:DinB family protein [Gemmatimonadales bacterium]
MAQALGVARTRRPFVAADALLKAYSASARVNQYLVQELPAAVWRAPSPLPKGRTIAALVTHLHNCGLRYLERTAPGITVPAELDRVRVTPAQAARALGAKRRAVLAIVGTALKGDGRIVGFPYDAAGYLSYYMVHDAHHRGQIVLQARLLGHPIRRQTMIGMWQWGKRAKE